MLGEVTRQQLTSPPVATLQSDCRGHVFTIFPLMAMSALFRLSATCSKIKYKSARILLFLQYYQHYCAIWRCFLTSFLLKTCRHWVMNWQPAPQRQLLE